MLVLKNLPKPDAFAREGSAEAVGAALPEDCRITHPAEVTNLLRRFVEADLPISLSSSDGTALSTSLWAEDRSRGMIAMSADPDDLRTQRLVRCNEAIAVGYLDSVRLQFEVRGLVLVHGREAAAINAEYPDEILRFQRRDTFRVRPLDHAQPTVTLPHPTVNDSVLVMRVTDISLGGIALVSRPDAVAYAMGQTLVNVVIELDALTQIRASLRIVHVGAAQSRDGGIRLGCEILQLSGDDVRVLQRYIDRTQHRRRMLSL